MKRIRDSKVNIVLGTVRKLRQFHTPKDTAIILRSLCTVLDDSADEGPSVLDRVLIELLRNFD